MSEKHQKFLRLADVQSRVPYSKSNLYRLMAEKKFPQRFKIGAKSVAWLESDIDDWIASRVSESPAEVTA